MRLSLSLPVFFFFRWLKAEGLAPNTQGEVVISQCAQHLLTMISEGYFKKGPFCLTMPFYISLANDNKIKSCVIDCDKLHISAQKMIYAMKSLFVEMESTKTFQGVTRFLLTKSKEENELALQMVQCRSDLSGFYKNGNCQSECCLQPSENTRETVQLKALHKMTCCGGHEAHSDSSKAINTDNSYSVDLFHDCETGSEIKCSFQFDCRPEHIVTMFLFVWPHDDLSLRDRKLFCSASNKVSHASENLAIGSETNTPSLMKDPKKISSTHEIDGLPYQKIPLINTLLDFLHTDLENIEGTYFEGEIQALMIKFHEVMKYHCHRE